MKDLMICTLATLWVLEVIYWMGRRRHLRVSQDHIDRDFREMVARYKRQIDKRAEGEFIGECRDHGANCRREQRGRVIVHIGPPTRGRGRSMCPLHGWQCLGGH